MGMCAAQFLIPIRVSRNSESWWFIRKNQSEWDVDIYIRSTLYISRRDERYEGSGARWRIFWLLSSFAADASRWSCPFSFLRASERAREKFVVGIKQKIEKKKIASSLSLSLLVFLVHWMSRFFPRRVSDDDLSNNISTAKKKKAVGAGGTVCWRECLFQAWMLGHCCLLVRCSPL